MREAYGQFAALYDPLMREVDYDGWAAYLASFLPAGIAVADCACGTGEITVRLARLGFRMTGVDISPAMLEVAAAKARKADIVIVDTAGRLHTKVNLMEELKKVKRIILQNIENRELQTLLVLDATTGQNGINQVKTFHEAVGVDRIAITKLDGTAKGGIILAIANQFKIPISLIGVGENQEDLQDFDPQAFANALFNRED